ncbi:MAG TPA: HEAT repeat domain-containing protein [Acidimicrobiales bacterium]|nr:HEAT repeat domain-containing protein [Acidimicrobiales bacterium]
MPPTQLDHPRQRIARLTANLGEPAVVAGCRRMLEGQKASDEVVEGLGGVHATRVLDHAAGAYWGRVWGARGLLYVWGDEAIPALRAAVTDEHWRVREMVAKVVARRRVDALAGDVARLRGDEVPRVRAAAERALVTLATPTRGPARGSPRGPAARLSGV